MAEMNCQLKNFRRFTIEVKAFPSREGLLGFEIGERYRALPNGVTTTHQPGHALVGGTAARIVSGDSPQKGSRKSGAFGDVSD